MNEPAFHHLYSIESHACRYCNKPWRKITDRWCMRLAEIVELSIQRAKERQQRIVDELARAQGRPARVAQ